MRIISSCSIFVERNGGKMIASQIRREKTSDEMLDFLGLQALRHQYVLSSLYVSAPNNNSRRDNLHNGPATAKRYGNENGQNSSNPHKHTSVRGKKVESAVLYIFS